jgi:type VI secretion system secreted protein VgrG
MPDYKQAGRLMQFDSVLGTDKLLIDTFEGVEGISRLFDFQAELFADAGSDIDPSSLIGTKATVTMNLLDVSGTRYYNGMIAAFEQTSGDDELDVYRAHLVPSLWQLTLSTNCRVFQNMAPMDIIKKVISPYGITMSDSTTGSYKSLEYCTQYDETDFAFISRIAEQFGIFYWFEHKESDNTVYFGDNRSAYSPCPDVSEADYSPQAENKETMYRSIVSDIRVTASMATGRHSSHDYDFRSYAKAPNGPATSTSDYGKNALERYSYPTGTGGYAKAVGTAVSSLDPDSGISAALRDANDVPSNVFYGVSNARSFIPGFTYTLNDHPRDDWNQDYLLMEVAHHATQQPPYRADASSQSMPYTNRFSSIESDRTFRPVARTPKPRIYGPQTAKVVVPNGEDMFLDKLGRVSVQFFWDRERQDNTVDNTWVRVGQPWAGNGWGTYFWPRANDEVIVNFLNGDPDDPIITASVYNGVNVPKYELPDMSTRSGIVTRSSKDGSAANANELRFEDKTGSEQIFINAEKDMDHRIENDHRTYVGGQDSLIVKNDQLEDIGATFQRSVKGNVIENWAADADFNIGTGLTVKAGGDHSLQVGGNEAVSIGKNYAMDSTGAVYIKAGSTIVLEATAELTLKGPGGFITIDPSGVAISGMMVKINSGGAAGSGTAGSTKDPATPKPPDEADDGTKGGAM